MTELYLLRHADAGDPEAWNGRRRGSPAVGQGREAGRPPRTVPGRDRVPRRTSFLTSPKVRALRTAEIVAERLGSTATVEDRLAGGLDAGVVDAILRDAGDPERPVLVGHDPDFTELLQSLTALDGRDEEGRDGADRHRPAARGRCRPSRLARAAGPAQAGSLDRSRRSGCSRSSGSARGYQPGCGTDDAPDVRLVLRCNELREDVASNACTVAGRGRIASNGRFRPREWRQIDGTS